MFSALLSFLGGSAFRFVIGRATDWLEKRQEYLQEIARIREQEKLDAAAHERQMAMIRLQAELKVNEVKLAGEAAVSTAEAQAFVEAMKTANAPIGVKWVDAWNGLIRPLCATISVLLWLLSIVKAALVLTEWDKNLVASIIGYYFADRHIGKTK
ncbi:MAG: hypothetical protein IVW56_14295 [Candidatus Binataceae bacterium]|nr:hypothetical protein [Candidatus Binataceae bacterium]